MYHNEFLNCLYHKFPLRCMWIKRFFFHFYWSKLQKNSYWTLSCPNVYLERGCRWISSLAAGAECALVVGTRQHLMPKTFTQTHTETQSRLWWQKTISRYTICQTSWQPSPSCIKINRIKHLCTELQAPCHFRHLEHWETKTVSMNNTFIWI